MEFHTRCNTLRLLIQRPRKTRTHRVPADLLGVFVSRVGFFLRPVRARGQFRFRLSRQSERNSVTAVSCYNRHKRY